MADKEYIWCNYCRAHLSLNHGCKMLITAGKTQWHYRYIDNSVVKGRKHTEIVFECIAYTDMEADNMFKKETGADPNKIPYIGITITQYEPRT